MQESPPRVAQRCFRLGLVALLACVLGAANPVHPAFAGERASPGFVDVAAQMERLVEADWVNRDARFSAAKTGTLPANVDAADPVRAKAATFSWAHIRDVISRARSLAERLRPGADAKRLAPLAAELETFQREVLRLEEADEATQEARRKVYLKARRLVRQIAFCNPLLDFDKLLFIKRHDPGGVVPHVRPVLRLQRQARRRTVRAVRSVRPDCPRLVNLLANAVVENGPAARARSCDGGSFLSPELSFDGRTILFAYSRPVPRRKETVRLGAGVQLPHLPRSTPTARGLVQLTDGPWDDFDPCFLPDGRIAFISERRGGYLRCGRHCPTYTLFSHGARRQRHHLPELSRDARVASQRRPTTACSSTRAGTTSTATRTSPITSGPAIPTAATRASLPRQLPRAAREPAVDGDGASGRFPARSKFVATAGGASRPRLRLAGADRSRASRTTAPCRRLTRLTPEVPFPEAEGGKGPSASTWPTARPGR